MSPGIAVRRAIGAVAMLMAVPAFAQQPGMMHGNQQHDMQQHMSQMQEMMRQMSDMAQRSTQMQQQMKRDMSSHMQSVEMGAGHMAMPQMAGHLGSMATEMKRFGEKMQTMMKDQTMMSDPAMQRAMDGMHEHMAAVSREMSNMLDAMEKMHKGMGSSTTHDPTRH